MCRAAFFHPWLGESQPPRLSLSLGGDSGRRSGTKPVLSVVSQLTSLLPLDFSTGLFAVDWACVAAVRDDKRFMRFLGFFSFFTVVRAFFRYTVLMYPRKSYGFWLCLLISENAKGEDLSTRTLLFVVFHFPFGRDVFLALVLREGWGGGCDKVVRGGCVGEVGEEEETGSSVCFFPPLRGDFPKVKFPAFTSSTNFLLIIVRKWTFAMECLIICDLL